MLLPSGDHSKLPTVNAPHVSVRVARVATSRMKRCVIRVILIDDLEFAVFLLAILDALPLWLGRRVRDRFAVGRPREAADALFERVSASASPAFGLIT